MKTIRIEDSIIQILGPNSNIVGAGFCAAPNLFLTCTHVLLKANTGSGQLVRVRFLKDRSQSYLLVDELNWQIPEQADIAILRSIDNNLQNVQPISFGQASKAIGKYFISVGFPQIANYDCLVASGRIEGSISKENGLPMLQITSQQLDLGFSGSPVICDNLVVGMISEVIHTDGKNRDTAFAIPVETLWTRISEGKPKEKQQYSSPINPNTPLLIGIAIDFSREMLFSLHEEVASKKFARQIESAYQSLAQQAIAYCRTPEAEKVLPRFAMFAYGYGFGQRRANLHRFLTRIGVMGENENETPSSPVRDLFSETLRSLNLSTTPTAFDLYTYWDQYKNCILAQQTDLLIGPPALKASLETIYERFQQELILPYYPNPVLLLLSSGKCLDGERSDIIGMATAIRNLGVEIVCGFIGEKVLPSRKILYAQPQDNWPPEVKLLYESSSQINGTNQVMVAITEVLGENGWKISSNSRLFVQANHPRMLNELIQWIISPLRGDKPT